ncbi:hypothetical protein HS088_TW18G00681 [Tripterygium wilfordii]|uniref:Uncharacterized protein n=1 Tax=Tripterygium wilfordii TaxID=458696 RepID=A0A7J7CCV2_TRIWF|nr:uncharacterized protein LOC119984839 [Tripterygium wilfordii]KAF5731994.1 hypothetical protein HS088_TW18G00681 [Tripterygium wilfordii]
MWAVSPTCPCLPLIPRPTNTKPPLAVTVSATSDEQQQQHRSSPIREQKQQQKHNPKQAEGAQSRQLKGLDVLWAMQKAAAEKNKLSGGSGRKNKRRKGLSSSEGSDREEDDVDYSNVRPLCIKEEWGVRLDELEKRLQELSENK